jgi:hypothetical protein
MTLTDLLHTLQARGAIPASRIKDLKTSIRYLACALGKDTPDRCVEADLTLAEPHWKAKLNRYFGSLSPAPSPHTVRNTRNNLSFLFRTAANCALLTPALPGSSPSLSRRALDQQCRRTSPYRERWHTTHDIPYGLKPAQWPHDIYERWQQYCTDRQLKTRARSLTDYTNFLKLYLGFLITIQGLSIQWNDLFDLTLIDQYVRWNSQRSHTRITVCACRTVSILRTVARHFNHPHASAITAYHRELPMPEPVHRKKDYNIKLHELETAALRELQEAYRPVTGYRPGTNALTYPSYLRRQKAPGLVRALQYQRALTLRLMIRIPLRVRNFCEMQLDRNLYQDEDRHWHLHFQGDELKKSVRNGRINEYHVNLTTYCPELIPQLEEFLAVFRPRIPHATTISSVFLSRSGRPYHPAHFQREITAAVLKQTHKRFYPHLIRTIWASEYIARTGDFTTAALMLGDTVQVVLQRYHEILEKDHQQKASHFLADVLSLARS